MILVSNGLAQRPQYAVPSERSYPERYIFLVLFFIIFVRLMKGIQKYRRGEEELDVFCGGQYFDDIEFAFALPSPAGYQGEGAIIHLDDPYEAGMSSFASLDAYRPHPRYTTPTAPSVQQRRRVQRLLSQLRAATYSGTPQEIEALKERITELMTEDDSSLMLTEVAHEPPPAYTEIINLGNYPNPPPT
ncbi:hypothetical protein B0H34DRAFT_675540 [Crassisporium funariophilum]|nr:hypothetical protein B0H34DRAFT_675540 [Crassisporium funariophilum]